LRADPGNAAAAGNLGAFLRLTGEIEAAETVLRDVIAANPGATAARINFAADLLQEDRAAEARRRAKTCGANGCCSGYWRCSGSGA
jgi:Flp pilus assembly protein TadD